MMMLLAVTLAGCRRYMPPGAEEGQAEQAARTGTWTELGRAALAGTQERLAAAKDEMEGPAGDEAEGPAREAGTAALKTLSRRLPVKVKGIYVSAYVAGTETMMDKIIQQIDGTELNTVVIDVKDDNGRVTFAMDTPMVRELGASVSYIPDMGGLMEKLKEHNLVITRHSVPSK